MYETRWNALVDVAPILDLDSILVTNHGEPPIKWLSGQAGNTTARAFSNSNLSTDKILRRRWENLRCGARNYRDRFASER